MPSSNKTLFASVILAAITGAGSGWYVSQYNQESVDLRLRPPIAVLNYVDALKGEADQVDSIMLELDTKAAQLADAGFLVINGSAVVAYPEHMRVPVGGGDE
ncbi:hypothetical protein T35B1_11457 [Salinisphaera shabanensis T35B1]|uniref:hypothetical protein n=1 Tax=Salinisphaera TaxID=180541 RepID=UPI003341E89E